MGLNPEAGALRQVNQIFRSKRLVGATVERFDVCPLQLYHVKRKPERGSGITRIAPQPSLKTGTQITQSERLRRTIHQISLRQALEGSRTDGRQQAREVLTYRSHQTEPIASPVNIKA